MSKAVPTSFDFDNQAIRPDYVVKCSYGNDSIALLQFLHEYDLKFWKGQRRVAVLYNDTGYQAAWWGERVKNGERLVQSFGFIPCRTESMGMLNLILERNMWPDSNARFCTQVLKILPTLAWLSIHDPAGLAETLCGVRREESDDRALWPEWVDSERTAEGRAQWSPLVLHTTIERDALIARAGWKVLPHRSRECKCVLANASDIKTWGEQEISEIEEMEAILGRRQKGVNQFCFNPNKRKGRPHGIRAVVEWAKKVKSKERPSGGCDSGYCTG